MPEATRITALLVIYGIVIVFWMVFHQNGSTMTYWADENTAWNVSGVDLQRDQPVLDRRPVDPPGEVSGAGCNKRGLEPSTPTKMALGMLLTSLAFLILFVAAKSGGDQTFVTDAQRAVRARRRKGEFKVDPAPRLAALADRGLHGDLARRADAQPDGPVARLEGRPGRGCAG